MVEECGEVCEEGEGVMVGVDGCGWVRLGVGDGGGSWRWCGRGGPGWSRRRWWVRWGG